MKKISKWIFLPLVAIPMIFLLYKIFEKPSITGTKKSFSSQIQQHVQAGTSHFGL